MADATEISAQTLGRGKQFFQTGRTLDLDFRLGQLRALLAALIDYEEEILRAVKADLGKPTLEGYMSEILQVKGEIKYFLKRLPKWVRNRSVTPQWFFWPAKAWVQPEPHGVALVLSAWNYPIQLSLVPLIAAISAGNCVVLKPSELAPRSAEVLNELLSKRLEPDFVSVICGDGRLAGALANQPFDFVFFTGSEGIGRRVAEMAGRNLAPCVLELGGKSPCIIAEDAPLETTARRLVWGKFLNAGQTCVAPDHVFVHQALYAPLLEALKRNIRKFYGEDARTSEDFARIVNEKHFNRLVGYLGDGDIYHGGHHDRQQRYIEPTILTNVPKSAPIRSDEIFGPILPVEAYDDLDGLLRELRSKPAPLVLYLHTKSRAVEKQVLGQTRSGSVCLNDHVVHVTVHDLPFGGSGASGMGRYHGRSGFETFSQQRSVMRQPWFFDNPLRYPPGASKLPLIKRLIG